MRQDEGESLIDRVRNAFGRTTDGDAGEVVNRPAGPDYAAEEPIDTDFSAGLRRADTTNDFDGMQVPTDGGPPVRENVDELGNRGEGGQQPV